MSLDTAVDAEKRIGDATEGTRREAERLGEQLEDQNKKRAVAAALEKRLAEAARSTKESRIQTETDTLLSTSRSLGSGIDPKEARRRAEAIIAAEDRVKESEKTSRGGGRKTDEEKFADRLRLLRAEGEAAFFNDSDKAVIEELKKLKSQPGLAEAAVRDVKSGRGLQGDALQIRDALERKKAGQEFNTIIEKYGDGAQLAEKFAEKQRILNIMVSEGKISADQAGLAFADYLSKFQNFQWIDKLADAFTSLTETLITEPQNWKNALQTFFKDATKLAIQETISTPLKNAIRSLMSQFVGGFGGGGGGIGGFIGMLFGGSGGASNPLDFSRGATGLYGPGFSGGGFTGHGHRDQPKGVVHAGEVVWSQDDVRRAGGVSTVEAMRLGYRGYAGGGAVDYAGVMAFGEAQLMRPANDRSNAVSRLADAVEKSRGGEVNIHNTVSDQVNARAERGSDGSLKVIIEAIKGDIADGIVRGQGSVSTAIRSVQSGRQLRG